MPRKRAAARSSQPSTGLADEFEEMDLDLTDVPANETAAAMGDVVDLDDDEFADWEWMVYRLRSAEEMNRIGSRNQRVWVTKRSGPINLNEIQAEFGGGWFEFWGKLKGVLRKKVRREIEGEPRIFRGPATPPPTATAAAETVAVATKADPATRMMMLMMREQRRAEARMASLQRASEERTSRLIELLLTKAATPAAPPQTGLLDLIGGVKAIHELTGSNRAPRAEPLSNPLELAKEIVGSFYQGITVGEGREAPASESNPYGPLIPIAEKALDVLNNMIGRQQAARAAAARAATGAAPPRPASEAHVVDTPAAANAEAPATATASDELTRWMFAVKSVYTGMLRDRDAGAVADGLESILEPGEVAKLRGVPGAEPTAQDVLTELAMIQDQFPQLWNEQGKAYLGEVLAALRTQDDDSDLEATGTTN